MPTSRSTPSRQQQRRIARLSAMCCAMSAFSAAAADRASEQLTDLIFD